MVPVRIEKILVIVVPLAWHLSNQATGPVAAQSEPVTVVDGTIRLVCNEIQS
jgi:hypothetical protein